MRRGVLEQALSHVFFHTSVFVFEVFLCDCVGVEFPLVIARGISYTVSVIILFVDDAAIATRDPTNGEFVTNHQ